MIITIKTNKNDWYWLWNEWLEETQDGKTHNPGTIFTTTAEIEDVTRACNHLLNKFGVETEDKICDWGHRTFKIVNNDKFMMEKIIRSDDYQRHMD